MLTNRSSFAPDRWRFEALGDGRKLIVDVEADRRLLAGVTYHDPDGQPAYCYNTEVADMSLEVFRRRLGGWRRTDELRSERRAHFEYAQRTPVEGIPLSIT